MGNRLKRNDQRGGNLGEGVVIETKRGETFKRERVVNHVKSCRDVGENEDRKVSIEFSNKEVIIDFSQRGFQGVIRSGSQIAVGRGVNGGRGSLACL